MADVTVVGGGLSGSEAAYQLAERGHRVTLLEMRPGGGAPPPPPPQHPQLVR
jgi:methylenetetrahydrofolate--tRNA-(uracil-5-)-methyltransferase